MPPRVPKGQSFAGAVAPTVKTLKKAIARLEATTRKLDKRTKSKARKHR